MSVVERAWHLVFSAIFLTIAPLVSVDARAQVETEPAAARLNITVTPYFWLLGVNGTFSVAGLPIPVDINPFELISSADSAVGFQGRIAATSGRWGALADLTYGSIDLGIVPLPPVTIFGIAVPVPATRVAGDVILLEMMGSGPVRIESPAGQL